MNLTLKTVWYGGAANELQIKVDVSNTTLELTVDDDIKKAVLEVLQSAAEEQFARRFITKDALGPLADEDVAGVLLAGDPGLESPTTPPSASAPKTPHPGHKTQGDIDNLMRNIAVDISRKA